MDWQDRINAAIDLMEARLEGELDWAEVAAAANCSSYHFFRVFEVVAGMGPADYVRRRRLSLAALELAAGKAKVIDLALRWGYETPEAFCKAFKRLFGLTPTEARSAEAPLSIFTRMRVSLVLKGAIDMQYRIQELPATKVTGLVGRFTAKDGANMREIPEFWRRSNEAGHSCALAEKSGKLGLLGICLPYEGDGETFEYMIGIEAPSSRIGLPPGCKDAVLPAATYAVFESRGPMPGAIQETWKRAFSEWFPASGYEHAGTPDFEVYPRFPPDDPRGDPASPQCYTEVWIPLKKKKT
jgi:AraC family transcriptional regulator